VEVRLGLFAGAADSALAVDDEAVRPDKPGLQQWCKRQDGRRWIAAGIGDELRLWDSLSVQLWQAVHRLGHSRGIRVFVVVPLLVNGGVVQPVVGAEVDDSRARGEEVFDDLGAGRMGEAAEDAVGSLGEFCGIEVFQPQVESTAQGRMNVAEVGLVVLPRGEGRDLGVRVGQQEPNQLLGGVTGGSEDGDADHCCDSGRSGASGELVNISARLQRREGRRRARRRRIGRHCWLAQQWVPGTRLALLDEPAVAHLDFAGCLVPMSLTTRAAAAGSRFFT
jgi:hypothetical protein